MLFRHGIQTIKQSLATHTSIAELIKERTDNPQFLEFLQAEQELVNYQVRKHVSGRHFINILRARFSYESASRSFSLTFWQKKHFRTMINS